MVQKTKDEILAIEGESLVIGSNKLNFLKLEVMVDIRDNLDKLNETLNRVGSQIQWH